MNKVARVSASVLLLGVVGFLAFKLFEPVFTYRSGWNPLPPEAYLVSETRDPAWSEQSALAEQALQSGREKMEAPALSAALSIDGKLVWRGAVGLADVERQLKADFNTRFRIGSTSKAVTAVGVGVLIDRRQLSLDQPVVDFPHAVVRRQNIWRKVWRGLAERWPRLGFDLRRRACGVASADVRWSVV